MSRQDLLNALQALHHHPDGNVKKQASDWLEHWGYSVEAWSICDSILHDASSTLESRIFCAQTLRTKVHEPHLRRATLPDTLSLAHCQLLGLKNVQHVKEVVQYPYNDQFDESGLIVDANCRSRGTLRNCQQAQQRA